MTLKLRLLTCLLAAGSAAYADAVTPSVAPAPSSVWNFTADCTDCGGTATLQLRVFEGLRGFSYQANYASNWYTFSAQRFRVSVYDPDPNSPPIDMSGGFHIPAGANVDLYGFTDLLVSTGQEPPPYGLSQGDHHRVYFQFATNPTGEWLLSLEEGPPNDYGTGGSWAPAAVPEPSTVGLMALGAGILGLRLRKRSSTLS